jgi:hypothetical protein
LIALVFTPRFLDENTTTKEMRLKILARERKLVEAADVKPPLLLESSIFADVQDDSPRVWACSASLPTQH